MRRPKKDRSGMVRMADLLEGALSQLGVRAELDKARLDQKCRERLGEKISGALVRVGLKGGKVTLEFPHSIWINEMNFRKEELLRNLQKDLPQAGIKKLDVVLAKAKPTVPTKED